MDFRTSDNRLNNITEALRVAAGAGNVFTGRPTAELTTFKVGGPADVAVDVFDADTAEKALRLCIGSGTPFYVIGKGSNLVFCDAGFRGVIIRLRDDEKAPVVVAEDDSSAMLSAGAGMTLSRLAHAAMALSLSGLEFAAGIPGSVGGGLFMNAGAYGGELYQTAVSTTYIKYTDGSGRPVDPVRGTFSGAAQLPGYRTSVYQNGGYVITGGVFRLIKGVPKAEIAEKIRELNAKRREKQPLEYPSAGSAFKRPKDDFAGRLIQETGLRGFSVGGAQVSEKHCGFIINKGGASAEDVRRLVEEVRERVNAAFGVLLEPEIKFVGESGVQWNL